MKKSFILPVVFSIIVIFVYSCELLDEDNPENVIDKIEGQWSCDETNSLKSTLGEQYIVYISPDPDDTSRVLISNFYNLGENVEAVARVNGNSLTLSRQNLPGDYTLISGSGTISSNYKTINWSYSVDDGSGETDHATAVYTKSY